jgi:hypothetical protein
MQAGFTNYGRALEAWVRRVLTELHHQFDANADAQRAQLARLMNRRALSGDERTTTQRHLAELESLAAEDVAN